jgi:hypothetical protein
MPTLDDLPPYRRARLLWRWAHNRDALERMVRERVGEPCRVSGPPGPCPVTEAVRGDDGCFHLVADGKPLCSGGGWLAGRGRAGWEHRQPCSWWQTDAGPADRYEPGAQLVDVVVSWAVAAVGPAVDPQTVAAGERCAGGGHYWPPTPARTASIRRLRQALVDELGAVCHLCGALPGRMVDHDYESGLVRGLLCAFCNRVVEECPHIDECPRAQYMAVPPAAHLALMYPASQQWRPSEATRRKKIALLGFDPLADWR